MLELNNISKRLGDFSLEDINLSINKNEYFVILGISGAGKSVLLEMIAGMVTPDVGTVVLNGKNITHVSIQNRDVGIVFQDFAVFPHMTVLKNILYPLKNMGLKKAEAIETAKEYAREMNISHLLDRMPDTLSGGELQRVALTRTLATKPDFLLLDEPLASVDSKLKDEIRGLLRNIHRKGITIIHVTHDYEEAVSLAEKIAVIYQGKLIQTGTAKEVFHNPKSEFIANFTGIKNFYRATYNDENVSLVEESVFIHHYNNAQEPKGYLLLRSEDVILSKQHTLTSTLNNFEGTVMDFFPCIHGIEVQIDIGIKITAHITHESVKALGLERGKKIWVSFKSTAVKFIPHDE